MHPERYSAHNTGTYSCIALQPLHTCDSMHRPYRTFFGFPYPWRVILDRLGPIQNCEIFFDPRSSSAGTMYNASCLGTSIALDSWYWCLHSAPFYAFFRNFFSISTLSSRAAEVPVPYPERNRSHLRRCASATAPPLSTGRIMGLLNISLMH